MCAITAVFSALVDHLMLLHLRRGISVSTRGFLFPLHPEATVLPGVSSGRLIPIPSLKGRGESLAKSYRRRKQETLLPLREKVARALRNATHDRSARRMRGISLPLRLCVITSPRVTGRVGLPLVGQAVGDFPRRGRAPFLHRR